MRNLENLLKAKQELKDFLINEEAKESFELFFVKDKLETVRKTNTLDQKVTIYVKNGEFLGNYTFSLLASDTKASFEKKLDEAIFNAKLIKNKDYDLPSGTKTNHNLKSNIKDYSPLELGTKIFETIQRAISKTSSKINALEVFINKKITKVINSRGVNRKMTSYDVFIEAIPTYDSEDSFELYKTISFAEFNEEKLEREVIESLNNVKARAEAKAIELPKTVDVLLNIEEVCQFFDEINYNLTYPALYSKSSIYELNDTLTKKPLADKVTMKATSKLPSSIYQRPFDVDGVLLKEKKLISNNKVVGFYGATRFSSYLGMEQTGDLPCFEVKPGSLKLEDLNGQCYLNCLSFSGLQVDFYQDYIGGEVRLGILNKDNEQVSVSSFTISGKASDVLKDLHLSSEVDVYSNYKGPKYLLIKNMKIC